MDWTEETIARLRLFWSEGHSTAEIGRRLGVTKNAVVGKAHRLLLPPRPSPIHRGPEPAVSQPRRVTGPTLPGLPATPEAGSSLPGTGGSAPVAVAPVAVVAGPGTAAGPAREARSALRPVVAPVRAGRISTCCWPIGEPGTRAFHFCDDPAMTGRPYCETHALLAYVKVRDRREEAA